MYEISTINSKTERKLIEYIELRGDIKNKLDRLAENPYNANGAHPLRGKLKGKWACWLGSNLRIIYLIDDKNKTVVIDAVGTHKIY